MAKSTAGIDAAGLRRVARLPLYAALMASCDRLARVDPEWAGKPAPARERKK
jgi:hypothetical protein